MAGNPFWLWGALSKLIVLGAKWFLPRGALLSQAVFHAPFYAGHLCANGRKANVVEECVDKVDRIEATLGRLETKIDVLNAKEDVRGDSLSILVLKEVLFPMVLKLFTFFSVVVLGLLGGILGLKWLFSDIGKIMGALP